MTNKKINVVIERGVDGTYSAFITDNNCEFGCVGEGKSVEETKNDFLVAVDEMKEIYQMNGKKFPDVKFNFTYGGLFCRPAENTGELVAEGMQLTHCVGTYAERYANFKTHIIFIRHVAAPDKPYYTMEVSIDNHIVQVRGFKNCGQTDEVQEFVNHFKTEVLSKLKKGRKVA